MMVLHIGLEMVVEAIDARGEQRDLHFGRTGVAFGALGWSVMTFAFSCTVTAIAVVLLAAAAKIDARLAPPQRPAAEARHPFSMLKQRL